MPLVFAAIAPHGGIAIAEACEPEERELAVATRAGMEQLGRLFTAAMPDVMIVATPHNVHISDALAVVVAARLKGRLNGVTPPIELVVPSDLRFACGILQPMAAETPPASAVSSRSHDPSTAADTVPSVLVDHPQ